MLFCILIPPCGPCRNLLKRLKKARQVNFHALSCHLLLPLAVPVPVAVKTQETEIVQYCLPDAEGIERVSLESYIIVQ